MSDATLDPTAETVSVSLEHLRVGTVTSVVPGVESETLDASELSEFVARARVPTDGSLPTRRFWPTFGHVLTFVHVVSEK
ncbi:hypothetical protein [Halorussus ruber]|uniref:hypothetical protein n=1 Tax=Halorussus ruber TaxID=1126238 RepID=UPI0010926560|nr:hypothetical protein [Halorussus ruber]